MIERIQLPKAVKLNNFLDDNNITLRIETGENTFREKFIRITMIDCSFGDLKIMKIGRNERVILNRVISLISNRIIKKNNKRISVPFLC